MAAASSNMEIIIQLKDFASKQLGAVENALNGVSSTVLNLKNAFLGLGAGVALGKITSTFLEFDDVMRQVGAVSRATNDEFKALEDQAKLMGETTRFTASQAADALRFMSMAGIQASDSVKLLPGVLNLASAGATDLGTAADITTNVLSGMSLAVEELGRVNDVLVTTATNSNTTVTELGEAFKTAAPAAKASGVALEEVSTVLGALANRGIKGSEAGNAIKRMLIRLQDPSKKAKEELEKLGIVTTDADGKFRGLIPVLKDLGAAQLDITGASKIFGLYAASAAVAASNAATDFDRLGKAMENSAGSAERIAKQMEAGIGGAFRSLQSAFEGVLIALGEGFDTKISDVFKYFTAELRTAIVAVKDFIANGSFDAWADGVVAAIQETYQYLKDMGIVVGGTLQALKPLFDIVIAFSPEFIAFGIAAAGAGKAIGLLKGGLLLTTSALSGIGNLMTSFNTVIMSAFVPNATAGAVAASALSTALLGIGAALGTMKIAEFGKILFDQVGIWQKNQAETDNYTKLLDNTLSKFEEFKNVSLPDLSTQNSAELTNINGALRKSAVYWETYIDKLRATNDGSAETNNKIKEATARLEKIKGQLQSVASAMDDYKNSSLTAYAEMDKANQNHVSLIRSVSDQFIKEEISKREELVQAEFDSYKQGFQSYEEFQAKKETITQQSEDRIKNIRLDFAQQIADSAQDEIDLAQKVAAEKIRLIEQEVETGATTREAANAKILQIENELATELKTIQLTTANEVNSEKERIDKESSEKYLTTVKDRNAQEKAALEIHLQELDLLQAQGKITEEQANNEKLALQIAYYKSVYDEAVKNFETIKNLYTEDSEQFKQALNLKNQTHSDYLNIMIENEKAAAETIRKTVEESQAEQNAIIEAGLENIGNKNQEITDSLAEPKPLNIDTEQGTWSVEELRQLVEETTAKISEPISMDIDTSPAQAALQQLAQEAQASAAAAYKSMIEIKDGIGTAFGEAQRVAQQQYKYMFDTYNESLNKWKEYKTELEKPTKSMIEFYGKASPEKPFSETIDDIQNKIFGLAELEPNAVTIPINADAGGGVGSLTDVLSNVKTQIADVAKAISPAGIANLTPEILKPQGTSGFTNGAFDVKDIGKVDLNVGNKSIPVITSKSTYLELVNEIRRREYMTIQGK